MLTKLWRRMGEHRTSTKRENIRKNKKRIYWAEECNKWAEKKNTLKEFNSPLDEAEEPISDLEDRTVDVT